jgi:hypothetical protein
MNETPSTESTDLPPVDEQVPAAAEPSASTVSEPETRWVATLRDPDAPAGNADLFQAAYASLARQLALQPDTLQQLRLVLDRRLQVAPPHRMLGEVTDALKALLGLDAAYLLHWLTYEQPVQRLAQIQPSVPPEVHVFLREVVAEHVTTFDLIQRTLQSSPEDWFDVDTRLVYNVTGQQFGIDLTLVKIDYSRVHLEMSPNSALALVSQLLAAAAQVNDASAFSEVIVQRWYDVSLEFQQLFMPPADEPAPTGEQASEPADPSG